MRKTKSALEEVLLLHNLRRLIVQILPELPLGNVLKNCEEAATVLVAVCEAKNKRNAVLSRPLRAPEKRISTAESFSAGKRTQMLRLPEKGNELKSANVSSTLCSGSEAGWDG